MFLQEYADLFLLAVELGLAQRALGVGGAVCPWPLPPRAGDIAGIYPSAGPGDRTLYAIARVNPGADPATTRSRESIIQVFVTGRDRQSLLCGAAECVHVRATRRAPTDYDRGTGGPPAS